MTKNCSWKAYTSYNSKLITHNFIINTLIITSWWVNIAESSRSDAYVLLFNLLRFWKIFFFLLLENQEEPRHFYYKSQCFPHFDRIRNLTKNCRSRLKEVSSSLGQGATLTREVLIKISCVGDVTDENLKLIAKRKGKMWKWIFYTYIWHILYKYSNSMRSYIV